MTSLPVPLVVGMAINRARLVFSGGVLGHALADIQERGTKFLQVGLRRFVLQPHDLRRVDHRPAAQRDDLVRFVEIERLQFLHDDLNFRLGLGDNRDMDRGFRRKVAPDDVQVADLLQDRIGNDNGGARWELTQTLHRVHVEVNLIGHAEPHRRLCPPGHSFDVKIMINIHVVGGAVAAAGPASE